MTTEKLFIFNPFNIKNWANKEVQEQYTILEQSLTNGDTPSELALDIEIYANMGYLIGEMIARFYEDVEIASVELKVATSTEIYKERDYWLSTKADKPPAMSYFESKALSKNMDDHKKLVHKESILKRFKFAYESIDQKQNALKKKLEAIKFDTFNR